MTGLLLDKYNVPVPRYTSYPPANYFTETFDNKRYREAIIASNEEQPEHLSFYIHIPFCRHLCHYCGCNSYPVMSEKDIQSYLEALHTEIDQVTSLLNKKRKIAQIHYGGGTPTLLPVQALKGLNEHLLSLFPTIEKPEIAIECHPGYPDEEYWKQLSVAGFNRFSLGIQDFNLKVLKAVNRRPPLLDIQMIIKILRESGAGINLDLLYGLPFQDVNSFRETVQKALSLHPDRIVTFSYGHLPHIFPRQKLLEKKGLPAITEKKNLFETAGEQIEQAGYYPIGLDHFVLRTDELYTALLSGDLNRNFQGYCTRRTTGQVYAFGVTAISQLESAYSQNVKDIRQYIERINKNGFAVSRGYSLNSKEKLVRKVIHSLMCNYKVDWGEISTLLTCPKEEIKKVLNYDEEILDEFISEGIIAAKDNGLEITPFGKAYVRNVAAALDPLMVNNQQSYSRPV